MSTNVYSENKRKPSTFIRVENLVVDGSLNVPVVIPDPLVVEDLEVNGNITADSLDVLGKITSDDLEVSSNLKAQSIDAKSNLFIGPAGTRIDLYQEFTIPISTITSTEIPGSVFITSNSFNAFVSILNRTITITVDDMFIPAANLGIAGSINLNIGQFGLRPIHSFEHCVFVFPEQSPIDGPTIISNMRVNRDVSQPFFTFRIATRVQNINYETSGDNITIKGFSISYMALNLP